MTSTRMRAAGIPGPSRASTHPGASRTAVQRPAGALRPIQSTAVHRVPAAPAPGASTEKGGRGVILFRQELGDVLREARRAQGRTLRQVSSDARVSLGYLSEIERGQKEASSELLVSVTDALGMPLSYVLREVSDRIAIAEGVVIPDTVPEGLADGTGTLVGAR